MHNNSFDNFWDEYEKAENGKPLSQSDYEFDEEPVFQQGVAIVKRNGKFGAIVVGGKEIVPTIYDELSGFNNGLARAIYKGEERVINLSGQIQVKKGEDRLFIPEKYDWGRDYSGNGCVVIKDGKYGLISDSFQELIEPLFDSIIEINRGTYFAMGKPYGIIFNIISQLQYMVSGYSLDEKGIFQCAVVSLPGNDDLWGILGKDMTLLQPIENDNITIEKNSYFVVEQKDEGVGLYTIKGEIIPKGKYDIIEVLNEKFVLCRNRDESDAHISNTSLFNTEGKCLIPSIKTSLISVTRDGFVTFDNFKVSSEGDLYYVVYGKKSNNYILEEIGRFSISLNFLNYEFIEPFTDYQFVVGKVDENGIFRFGIVNSQGTVLLPFEYSRLKILSKDFIAYSTEEENILDLKKENNNRDIKWLLYHTFSRRDGDLFKALNYGILNSDFKKICQPKYNEIKVVEVIDSKYFFLVSNGLHYWGIIDITDRIVLPIKFFGGIKFYNANNIYDPIHEYSAIKVNDISGIVLNNTNSDSEHKNNSFNKKGMFVVPLPDGGNVQISPYLYDWCDSFNDTGWATVRRNGLLGKINKKGELISILDEKIIVIPNEFDWAYDFRNGYVPVMKEGRWGVADKNWTLVIPCIYEFIEPITEGFFKYAEVPLSTNNNSEGFYKKRLYGIIYKDNTVITEAKYVNLWPLETEFFKVETDVENTSIESDRFGIISTSGNIVIPPNYSEVRLLRMDGKEFWIVTQNKKKGVICSAKKIVVNIYDEITADDGIFICKSMNRYGKEKILFKYNSNGEILLTHNDSIFVVPSEYDLAYYAGYGLIRVVKDGKWGMINLMNEILVPPQYDYIEAFDGQFAKVVNAKEAITVLYPDCLPFHVKLQFGLIDTLGEIALPIEYDNITKWENDYYLVYKDNYYILLSRSLFPIIKTNKRLERLNDIYILEEHTSMYESKYRYGLLDYNGKELIPLDDEHSFSKIEVLKGGFLKIIYSRREYGNSHIAILSCAGKKIYSSHDCDDLQLLDNGFIMVERKNYNHPTTYGLVSPQGKDILPKYYYHISFATDNMLSIKDENGWGIADIMGNIIIDPRYSNELCFEDGISEITVRGSSATQRINKKGVVIVRNGNNNIELPDDFYWGSDFINDICIVRSKQFGSNIIGVVDVKGNIVIPARYKSINILSNNTIRVQDNDCFGIYNLKGEIIFPPIFTSIEYISNDRIRVHWNLKFAKEWGPEKTIIASGSKFIGHDINYRAGNRSALCNYKGEIINDKSFLLVGIFKNGYACAVKELEVEKNRVKYKKIGVIDTNGKTIIPPTYDNIRLYDDSLFAQVKKDGRYGIAQLPSGTIYQFDNLEIKHMWDIDKYGRCVYSEDCEYDKEDDEWVGGSRGVLCSKGILVSSGIYQDITLLDNGLIIVISAERNLYGLLDCEGNEILPAQYTYISCFNGDYATICKGGIRENSWLHKITGGRWGVIDYRGNFIKECTSEKEDILEVKGFDNVDLEEQMHIEEPSAILSDQIPETKGHNSYDYGFDSYQNDDDGPYSKYGGYNGWDDNTIDDVFDGNPELTWNVD